MDLRLVPGIFERNELALSAAASAPWENVGHPGTTPAASQHGRTSTDIPGSTTQQARNPLLPECLTDD
jgi:hypothetical protein